MMQYIRPFQVSDEGTYALTVTGTAASITLPTARGNRSVRIVVKGTQDVYFTFNGTAAIPTSGNSAAGAYMLANTIESFFLSKDATAISFIAAGAGSTVYVTIGESA